MALSLTRFKIIRKWKELLPCIRESVLKVLPDSELYIIGSVAKGTYDSASDFDLLVVVNKELDRRQRVELLARIYEEFEKCGDPRFPLEIHFAKRGDEKKYEERVKIY